MAAALLGAVGAALVAMVAERAVERQDDDAAQRAVAEALAVARDRAEDLLRLADADVSAFRDLLDADPEDEAGAAVSATAVPLAILRCCCEIAGAAARLPGRHPAALASDLRCATWGMEAAARAAVESIDADLGALPGGRDGGPAARARAASERCLGELLELTEATRVASPDGPAAGD